MKLTINARELKATLKSLKPWVPTKANHKITEYVRIDSDDTGTHITAYDTVTAIRFPLPAFNSTPGSCVVRFKDLMDCTLKAEGEVTLEYDEICSLRISYETTTFTLKAKPVLEYIDIPTAWFDSWSEIEQNFSTQYWDFVRAANHAYIASESSQAKNFTSGIYLDIDKRRVNLVGTNGRRLHYASVEAWCRESDWNALIDAEIMKRLTKLPVESLEQFKIGPRPHDEIKYIAWQVGKIEGFTLPMDTPFPEWKEVIPEENGNIIEIRAEDLTKAVERMAPIAKSADGRDMIVLRGNGMLYISAKAESMGSGESELACDLHLGQDLLVALNYGFLLDALKLHKKDRIRITFGGELEPIMIRSSVDDTRSSILMPVRLPE